jgi:hypothetical protein
VKGFAKFNIGYDSDTWKSVKSHKEIGRGYFTLAAFVPLKIYLITCT